MKTIICLSVRMKKSHKIPSILYTLSHPENDRDITDRVQEYTLQDASFMRQSRYSFMNTWEKNHKLRARWQASSFGIRTDFTVVLDVRQSIVCGAMSRRTKVVVIFCFSIVHAFWKLYSPLNNNLSGWHFFYNNK